MPVKEITTDQLRRMNKKEGLVLQGCGGDLQEWLDGINSMLTSKGVLLNGSKFDTIYSFNVDDHTNLLFPFENVELNIGKFALWRITTYSQFNGTWLSDFVPNELGGYLQEKQKERLKKRQTRL